MHTVLIMYILCSTAGISYQENVFQVSSETVVGLIIQLGLLNMNFEYTSVNFRCAFVGFDG